MIGKRIILTIIGFALLVSVGGFVVGASISKSEVTALRSENNTDFQTPRSTNHTNKTSTNTSDIQEVSTGVSLPQNIVATTTQVLEVPEQDASQ